MKLNKNFVMKKIDEEYVLIPLGQEAMTIKGMLKMNEVGHDIYLLLEKGFDLDAIVDALAKDYDAPKEVLEEDVKEFVKQMEAYGVLK